MKQATVRGGEGLAQMDRRTLIRRSSVPVHVTPSQLKELDDTGDVLRSGDVLRVPPRVSMT